MKADEQDIYLNWENLVVQYKVKGKTSHDARLVAAVQPHGISHLLTFNVGDFKRCHDIITVVEPQEVI